MTLSPALLRPGFAAIALLLAPLLAVQAQVNAGGQAPDWAVGWNGFRLAEMARHDLAIALSEGRLSIAAPRGSHELALDAYQREPFATDALFVLAQARAAQNEAEADQILQRVYAIDQRNLLVGLYLLQRAAASGDVRAMIPLVDRLARVRPELASQLALGLSDAESLPFLAQILRDRPPWAARFWNAVPARDPELANFIALKALVGGSAAGASDAGVIRSLASAGQHDEAMRLWAEATGRSDPGTGFSNASRFPPVEWQLTRSGSIQAQFGEDGGITVYVEGGTAGELARQIVILEPGRYRWSSAITFEQGSGAVEAALQCTDSDGQKQLAIRPSGPGEVSWEVAPGACGLAWLILRGSAWQSPVPMRATLRQASFIREQE